MTLAAANLAYRYMNAGFVEEASEVLNKAKLQDNPHANVGSALADLQQKQEDEGEASRKYIAAAQGAQRFIRTYADHVFIGRMPHAIFAGTWKVDATTVATITEERGEFTAKWTVSGNQRTIKATVTKSTAKITTYSEDLVSSSGEVFYHIGTLSKNGYVYLSGDGQQISILIVQDNMPTFMTLSRIESAP